MRLLLVEDDRKLGPLLDRVLTESGYSVSLKPTVASTKAFGADIDVAIVDWMLPDGDGLEICMHLRRCDFAGPILMLTARGELRDRVHALDAGVDDYLTKPFAMDELLARLRALLRRAARDTAIRIGSLEIDLSKRNAFLDGRLVELTARELDLLAYLARRPERAVPKVELVENVWNAAEIVPNVVEVHVSRLRDKLGAHAWMVETVRGVGYRLAKERRR